VQQPSFRRVAAFVLVLATMCTPLSSVGVAADQPPTLPLVQMLRDAQEATAKEHWVEAESLWSRVVSANPTGAGFWSALGDARYRTRAYRTAIVAYRRAFELGAPVPNVTAYNIAASCSLLGERDNALHWVETSVALGFSDLGAMRSDRDFASLRDDATFRTLTFADDPATLSRDDGWRYDVRYLAHEIKRIATFPWVRTPETTFDAAISDLQRRVPQLTDFQIGLEMRKIIALLGRSHTILYNGKPGASAFQPLPFQTYFFDDGLFIIAADAKHKDLVGAQILRLDGHTPEQILALAAPFISQTNRYRLLRICPETLRDANTLHEIGLSARSDRVTLDLRSFAGEKRRVAVAADPSLASYGDVAPADWISAQQLAPGQAPRYLRNRQLNTWVDYDAQSRTAYLSINLLFAKLPRAPTGPAVDELFREVDTFAADKLVIDLRWDNGGNTTMGQQMFEHVMARPQLNRQGKLYVIIGRQTFSAGINTAVMFERYSNATLVGEPTSDSPNFVGETTIVTLPYSKSRAGISNRYWQTSMPTDSRVWLNPTLYAPPTFASFRQNRDAAMEAILAVMIAPS